MKASSLLSEKKYMLFKKKGVMALKSLRLRLLFWVSVTSLVACSSHDVQDYAEIKPDLDLFHFFQGDLVASGIVRNRSGKVIRYFNADIDAFLEGETLVLDERFVFSDGEEEHRVWKINRVEDASYIGTANDILNQATGRSAGNATRWRYSMNLKSRGREIKVEFDDWLYKTNDRTLINVSDIKKWGIKVADVVLVIHRMDTDENGIAP